MKKSIAFMQRAYKQMLYEIEHSQEKETGGFLLGHISEKQITVCEAVDGGVNVISNEYSFSYDEQYVEHVSKRLMALYTPPLEIVGVWHKHNSYHELPFSDADMEIHKQMYDISKEAAISCLFQKLDDSSFEMDVYQLLPEGKYEEVEEFVLNVDNK